ncbi:MAG: general secretion pathway protein GspK [Chlorobia bacterium]|nr:general secretion pathway protein GspK [Fimbriimonadaceae bacterium]
MRRTKRSGSIFVISLVVLAGLVSVLALAAASQNAANKAQIRRMEGRKARVIAEAAIQRALAELQDQVNSPTTVNDDWSQLGQIGGEAFELGNASFRVQIIDAASKVNLNTATQAQLELLPLDPEQVDAILDWREASTAPRPDGGKDEYYNQLENPYNAKLGLFQSVDELLLVKGITARDLYTVRTDIERTNQPTRTSSGEQVELPLEELLTVDSVSQAVNAAGQAKLNLNTVNQWQQIVGRAQVNQQVAQAIINLRPGGGYTNIGQVLATPGITLASAPAILNNCTTGGQNQPGKINLNTVTEEILLTIPNLPPDVASAIVTRQSTGFTELGELTDIPGMNNLALLQQTAGFFEVNSQSFVVRVVGRSGTTQVALQATVALLDGAPKIVRIEESPYTNVIDVWGWEAEPVATTTLKGAQ